MLKVNQDFLFACRDGDIDKIKEHIGAVNPSIKNNSGLRWACPNGNLEIVQLLLKDPDVALSAKHNALKIASFKGYTEMVNILLKEPGVDPSDEDNRAIKNASKCGHIAIVKLLLQDPRVDSSSARKLAQKYGHQDIVDLLAPRDVPATNLEFTSL